MRPAISTTLALLAAALIQDAPLPAEAAEPTTSGGIASAAKSAAGALASAGKDKLLVKDMLGAEVTGPGGETIGTVENLAVIPGGRVVAALLSTRSKDTGRIAVPFSAVKISRGAGKLGLGLPMSLSKLKSMDKVQALTKAVLAGKN